MRNIQLSIRLTKKEYIAFNDLRKQYGFKNISSFARANLLKDIEPIYSQEELLVLIANKYQMEEVVRGLNKIGVNINQIAKALNSGLKVNDLTSIKQEIRDCIILTKNAIGSYFLGDRTILQADKIKDNKSIDDNKNNL